MDEYNAQQVILREHQLQSCGFIISLTGASVFVISSLCILIRLYCCNTKVQVIPDTPLPQIRPKRTKSDNKIVEKPKIDIPTEAQLTTEVKATSSLSPFLKPFTVPKFKTHESKM